MIHFTVAAAAVGDDCHMSRRLSLIEHDALELITGLALIGAPLVLGLGPAALLAGMVAGCLVAGIALADDLPVGAHMAADAVLSAALLAAALALTAAGEAQAATLLALAASAELALRWATRWTRREPSVR